jgi:ribonuclease D
MKPMSDQEKPVLVTKPVELAECSRHLQSHLLVAVDTESNSLFAYREQVCLVQFSTPQQDYLVDALALDDLTPLAPIFASAEIEKIFHAAEYDIICLKRDYQFTFSNLFDTMQAARILGMKEFGLGALLETEFGIIQDKRFQRANWGERPLPRKLLEYAAQDTHSLIALRELLKTRLEARGLWELAQEDFQRLCSTPVPPENGKNPCWKAAGTNKLSPREMAVLNELCILRDQLARDLDRPAFKVFGNETLLELAKLCPGSRKELIEIKGLSPRLIEKSSAKLLQTIQHGLQSDPPKRTHQPRPSQSFLDRLDRLKNWRKEAGKKMEVESDVILPRELLEILAGKNPRNHQELAEIMEKLPWRLEHFGSQILKTLAHEVDTQ